MAGATIEARTRRLSLAIQLATLELKLYNFVRALERHYAPDQPRVPAGNPDGGQWTSVGGAGDLGVGGLQPTSRPIRVAAALTPFGVLRQKISAPGVSLVLCIYDFGNGLYSYESDPATGCWPMIHQSAVVPLAGGRGTRLNDN